MTVMIMAKGQQESAVGAIFFKALKVQIMYSKMFYSADILKQPLIAFKLLLTR